MTDSQQPRTEADALRALDGLATAVIRMKLAIPARLGPPTLPAEFFEALGDVNQWLDENDRVQARAKFPEAASLAAPAGLREIAAALHEMGLCRTKTTHTLRAHEPDADRLRAALEAAPRSPEPRPDHRWNDPDADGHNCADCADDSMWKCDIAAHRHAHARTWDEGCSTCIALNVARIIGGLPDLASPETPEAGIDVERCPAAKHHRIKSFNAARLIGFTEEGAEYEPERLTSDRCTACGYDFLAARLASREEGELP